MMNEKYIYTIIPSARYKRTRKLAKKQGFDIVRQKGSHIQLKHADGRRTTIPNHGGYDLAPGTLNDILKKIGLKEGKS